MATNVSVVKYRITGARYRFSGSEIKCPFYVARKTYNRVLDCTTSPAGWCDWLENGGNVCRISGTKKSTKSEIYYGAEDTE
jgi:hypothetical protein